MQWRIAYYFRTSEEDSRCSRTQSVNSLVGMIGLSIGPIQFCSFAISQKLLIEMTDAPSNATPTSPALFRAVRISLLIGRPRGTGESLRAFDISLIRPIQASATAQFWVRG